MGKGRHRTKEEKARILVDAVWRTDEEAARLHEISRQSVHTYRKQLQTDKELLQIFTKFYEEAKEPDSWAEDLSFTIREAMAAARRAFLQIDLSNPRSLRVVNETLQVLTEATVALRIIDNEIGKAKHGSVDARKSEPLAYPHPQVFAAPKPDSSGAYA